MPESVCNSAALAVLMFTSPDEDPAPGVVEAPLSAPPTAAVACCSPTVGTWIF